MTSFEILQATELFLLDLDGTVYVDETPIGAMPQTLQTLRDMGKKLVFLTNNSSKTEAQYEEKLRRIGLFGEGDGVYTSATATVEYLKAHHAKRRVFLLGTDALKEAFRAEGIVLDEERPAVCVLAYDVSLTFDKIRKFDCFLRHGVRFLATHPDDVCPTSDGSMPDVGSFLAMFGRSSGRKPDVIIGKPFCTMGDGVAARYGVERRAMCMVGDRMHTDIRFARNNKMHSVLVLSGETTAETMKNFPDEPDLVLPDLNAILQKTV